MKVLYLAIRGISKKWNRGCQPKCVNSHKSGIIIGYV
jgi:hypothetical protein